MPFDILNLSNGIVMYFYMIFRSSSLWSWWFSFSASPIAL